MTESSACFKHLQGDDYYNPDYGIVVQNLPPKRRLAGDHAAERTQGWPLEDVLNQACKVFRLQ